MSQVNIVQALTLVDFQGFFGRVCVCARARERETERETECERDGQLAMALRAGYFLAVA